MYYQVYELARTYYRDTVNLKQNKTDISSALCKVFGNSVKNIIVDNNYYSFELPFKPTRKQLRNVGEYISYYSQELRQYVIQGKSSRTLFKCVERNYKL